MISTRDKWTRWRLSSVHPRDRVHGGLSVSGVKPLVKQAARHGAGGQLQPRGELQLSAMVWLSALIRAVEDVSACCRVFRTFSPHDSGVSSRFKDTWGRASPLHLLMMFMYFTTMAGPVLLFPPEREPEFPVQSFQHAADPGGVVSPRLITSR